MKHILFRVDTDLIMAIIVGIKMNRKFVQVKTKATGAKQRVERRHNGGTRRSGCLTHARITFIYIYIYTYIPIELHRNYTTLYHMEKEMGRKH